MALKTQPITKSTHHGGIIWTAAETAAERQTENKVNTRESENKRQASSRGKMFEKK